MEIIYCKLANAESRDLNKNNDIRVSTSIIKKCEDELADNKDYIELLNEFEDKCKQKDIETIDYLLSDIILTIKNIYNKTIISCIK